MKYKKGDKVKVIENLDINKCYNEWYPTIDMLDFKGHIVTIDTVDDKYNKYTIEEDIMKFYWSDEMFEGLAKDIQKRKEFKLTDEFIKNGAIHCNTEEEFEDMIKWFKDNTNVKIEISTDEKNDLNNIYIAESDGSTFFKSILHYEEEKLDDNGYDIIEWTDYMNNDIIPKEIDKGKKLITFEDIDICEQGYELSSNKIYIDKYIKDNTNSPIYISDELKYSDIPNLIKWLQDVYAYGQQILNEIEYVDFNSALEWMKQGNKARLGGMTYYIENNMFKTVEFDYPKDGKLNLLKIDSKEWILLED